MWLDLETSIVEEFASAHARHVDATSIEAVAHWKRLERARERRELRAALHPRKDAVRKAKWWAKAKLDAEVRERRIAAADRWKKRNAERVREMKYAQWQRATARKRAA